MTKTTVTVSLSRANKYVERLQSQITSLSANSSGTKSYPLNSLTEGGFEFDKSEYVESFKLVKLYLQEMFAIKARIGAKNHSAGINELITQQEMNKRILNEYQKVLTAQEGAVSFEGASRQVSVITESARPGYGDSALRRYSQTVTFLEPKELLEVKANISRHQAIIFDLADQIAEKNASETVELELSTEVFNLVRGVAR